MRFSVDAHAIGRHLTGNEVYVRNLLHGFAAIDKTSEFIAYITRSPEASEAVPQGFRRRMVSANSIVRLSRDLPRRLAEDRPDLLHVQYTAPLRCNVPIVVIVHDVSYLEHPEYFPWLRMAQLRLTVRHTVERAARVIVPSQFSADAVARWYSVPPERIKVVHNGHSPEFRPVSAKVARGEVQRRLGIDFPYVMTVGDLRPRKNHIGLIRAFEGLIAASPHLPHHLVLAGQAGWHSAQVEAAARDSRLANRIHLTGFVNDRELLALYNASDCMVFPSFYEGFGLPVLEAMACGCPVVCSNTGALPEVASAAALLVPPDNPEEMARAIRDVLIDDELRVRMQRLGQARASLFTWEQTASKTLDVYYSVAGMSRSRQSQLSPVPTGEL